jgi:Ala-tRNA(Pro) deacylase
MSLVTMYLKDRHVPFEVLPHRRAVTSTQEARVLGVDADMVVKTVVLATGDAYWLAVIPASCRLDLQLVREALDDPGARLASEGELLVAFPRYELGALPPLGRLLGVAMLMDPQVLAHPTVVFAGGTETESVKVQTGELFEGEPKLVAPITREPEPS